jgi:hypothetical protein
MSDGDQRNYGQQAGGSRFKTCSLAMPKAWIHAVFTSMFATVNHVFEMEYCVMGVFIPSPTY